MNNSLTLAIVFLTAGILLTEAVTMVPAAYAGGDGYKDKKKYRDGYDSDNKNKAEYESAASIADCDKNYVAYAGFKCLSIAKGEVVEPEPETATLEVCKDSRGSADAPVDFIVEGNNPSPSEFTLSPPIGNVPLCIDVTIGPGEYLVEEDPEGNPIEFSVSGDCTEVEEFEARGEIQSGETQTCTFENLYFA